MTYLTEDFIVSEANTNAYNYLHQWPNWNAGIYSRMILLHGEVSCGKTHLTRIWQELAGAQYFSLENIHNLNSLDKALILEDIDRLDEELLLHLINFAHENQQYLLLTCNKAPAQLEISLADLRSRLLAIPAVAIEAPDQELLKAVLLKHLTDRQLKIHPAALDYVTLRIDRSFSKLFRFVEVLDKESKTSKRPITIPLIKEVLTSLI